MIFSRFAAVFLLLWVSSDVQAKLNVFACEPEWQHLVQDLGGDKVSAFSATHAFQDPHYIEARPALIAKLKRADLLVCTGAELEVGWLPLVQRKSRNPKLQAGRPGQFMASDFVKRLEIPHNHDRSQGDVHAGGNPHVHLDPRRLLKIARQLSLRLGQLDPDNKADYSERFSRFSSDWQAHIERWKQQASALKNTPFLVQHRNWSYLFDWLQLREVADLEPKPGLPPTSAHLQSLVQSVSHKQAAAIVIANYQDDRGAKWLANKIDRPVISLPFTVGGEPEADSLVALFDRLLAHLGRVSQP